MIHGAGPGIEIDGQMISAFRPGYVTNADEPKLKLAGLPNGERGLPTAAGLRPVMQTFAVTYINLAPDGGPQTVDVELDRGKSVELEIVDAEGQPVTGALISGIGGSYAVRAARLRESRTTIYALGGELPRKIVVLHEARRLAGTLTLTGDEPAPVRLVLGRSAAIRGRAVDQFNTPIAGVTLGIASGNSAVVMRTLENAARGTATDNEGRFRIDNLVPEERFGMTVRWEESSSSRS